MTRRYRGYDLIFQSEFELPGAVELDESDASVPDVTILQREVPTDGWYDPRIAFARLGQDMIVSFPGCATYRCTRHNQIHVDPDPAAECGAVVARLGAFAIPALLWMRGDILLHAGAAILPGDGVATVIAGHSGSGKTTVLRQLMEIGAAIVADDVVRIGRTHVVSGLPAVLSSSAAPGNRYVPSGQQSGAAPLGSVRLLLLPRASDEPEFERLPVVRAMEALLAFQYRPRIPRMLGLARTMLPALAGIAEVTPIATWRRSESRIALDERERSLLRGDLGIAQSAARVDGINGAEQDGRAS
jgi:hypothetical protein